MIEFIPIERPPEAFQVAVPLAQLVAICRHTFGQRVQIQSLREIGGGQFNTTYLVNMQGYEPVILRIAPAASSCHLWHETDLMRHELAMYSHLSPLNSLLPRILAVDFSHRLLNRDYLFQSFMRGTSWSKLPDDLSQQEHDDLWREFARLVKTISEIRGDSFGLVGTGPSFPTWSLTILDWLERSLRDALCSNINTTALRQLIAIVERNTSLLDIITQPRLLHGDLWWFNLLVERTQTGPRIVALLDPDRGSWGDPLADWTFFLLPKRANPQEQALFWQEYDYPAQDTTTIFRAHVYEGLHQAKILSVARRDHKEHIVSKANVILQQVVVTLQRLLASEPIYL
jgi:aminoglycoside phosphotransferase (APT) family kinase protein